MSPRAVPRLAALALSVAMTGCLLLVDLEGLSGSRPTVDPPDEAAIVDSGPIVTPDADAPNVPERDAEILPRSCKDIRGGGIASDGPQRIDPDSDGPLPSVGVYCEMSTDGGGWTLVARSVLNRSGDFGWRIARGSVEDDSEPYSLGDSALAMGFDEVLLASRSGNGKELGAVAYKLAISSADLTNNETSGVLGYAIATLRGSCHPDGGPEMLRFAGHTSHPTAYFFRDNTVLDDDYGLEISGFDTAYSNCAAGANLHELQGMLFVR